eukprot:GHVN01031492.1.p1 GENE.GHVN01031492.1~~GHVN01031492.1.p1  ORF type:complete len:336 (-),score=71.90 GHVN01031492.1:408-1415(-)
MGRKRKTPPSEDNADNNKGLPEKVVVGESAESDHHQVVSMVRAKAPGEALKKAEVIIRKRHIDREWREAGAVKRFYTAKQRRAEQFSKLRPVTPASMVLKQSRREWKDKGRLRKCDRLISYGRAAVKHAETHRVLFVFRNTKRGMSKGTKKILNELGIGQCYTGIFLPNTPSTMRMLFAVEPYVSYGYPSLDTVQRMFQKIGRLKTKQNTFNTAELGESDDEEDGDEPHNDASSAQNHNMTPTAALMELQMKAQIQEMDLSDNSEVEKRMGKFGILCVEDIVHEIWSNGKSFNETSEQLAPFRLAHLLKSDGLERKPLEAGNLSSFINKRLKQVV